MPTDSVLTMTSGSGAVPDVTADVVAVKAESGNYTGTITFRVTYTDKIPVSISGVAVESKTYDGKAAVYSIGKDVAVLEVADGKDVTETLAACGGRDNIIRAAWYSAADPENALAAAPANAGDYILVGKVETGEHYGIVELPFTIRKAAITVTAEDKAAYVGDTEPTYTYTVSGLAEGEKLATQPTAACPTADMTKAGSYPITVGGASAPAGGNYEDIVYVEGTLTVSYKDTGSSPAIYAVPVPKSTPNGRVSVSPQNAHKGSTVTVTVKPDEGYRLDKLTVTDRKGNVVAVSEKGDGKYTFIMPALRVNILADFVKARETAAQTSQSIEIDKVFSDVGAGDWYSGAVAYVYEKGIMTGTGDGVFSPDAVTTRGTIVSMLYRLENEPAVTSVLFRDVEADEWYAGGVAWATANGIVNGYGDGAFGPKDVITREQMVTILYRYAVLKGYDVSARADLSGFIDRDQISPYAADAFAWANAVGLINGITVNTLSPVGTASRAQIATMLMRFCEKLAK